MRWAISLMPQSAEAAATRSNDFIQVVIPVLERDSGWEKKGSKRVDSLKGSETLEIKVESRVPWKLCMLKK